jgi:hypothetical protein
MDDYKTAALRARLQLIRYLVSSTDQRGLTHGEKHYLLQTVLAEVVKAQRDLDDGANLLVDTNSDVDPRHLAMDDIPF